MNPHEIDSRSWEEDSKASGWRESRVKAFRLWLDLPRLVRIRCWTFDFTSQHPPSAFHTVLHHLATLNNLQIPRLGHKDLLSFLSWP